MTMNLKIYTIGHSTHTLEDFIHLLKLHFISAICDVRSNPYSKFNPQFNREKLKNELMKHDIVYVFLGSELGGRTTDPNCIHDDRVQYNCLAKTEKFREGIDRIQEGMNNYRIALMCAEKDPINCHRTILISRHLKNKEFQISHILEDGRLEENSLMEKRLMEVLKIPPRDFFRTHEELIESAYDLQSEKIAYVFRNQDEYDVEKENFHE